MKTKIISIMILACVLSICAAGTALSSDELKMKAETVQSYGVTLQQAAQRASNAAQVVAQNNYVEAAGQENKMISGAYTITAPSSFEIRVPPAAGDATRTWLYVGDNAHYYDSITVLQKTFDSRGYLVSSTGYLLDKTTLTIYNAGNAYTKDDPQWSAVHAAMLALINEAASRASSPSDKSSIEFLRAVVDNIKKDCIGYFNFYGGHASSPYYHDYEINKIGSVVRIVHRTGHSDVCYTLDARNGVITVRSGGTTTTVTRANAAEWNNALTSMIAEVSEAQQFAADRRDLLQLAILKVQLRAIMAAIPHRKK